MGASREKERKDREQGKDRGGGDKQGELAEEMAR